MLGPARDGGARVTLLLLALGGPARERRRGERHRAAGRLPGRRGGGRASSRAGSTWACSSPTPPRRSRPRASRRTPGSARRCSCRSRPSSAACAPWWRTPAARTSATASAGSTPAAAMQEAAARRLGVEPAQVGVASTGVIGHRAAARHGRGRRRRRLRRARPRGGELLAGDPHERQRPQARLPRRAPDQRSGQARGPGQGRRHDRAALRDDVLLRPDGRALAPGDARPAHRRLRQALLRPHLGRRAALHERHRVRARERRLGRHDRARVGRRARASARRSTRCSGSSR